MQPASIAVALRRRSPWEATDLGLAMLQRWWKPVYAAHALVFLPISALFIGVAWALDAIWIAILVIWWLEPLYDRAVLHVLSRAVFGEVTAPRSVLPCKAPSAEFAPDPALDPLWISYKEPFHAAIKKDFGLQVTIKVAEDTNPPPPPEEKKDGKEKLPEPKPETKPGNGK